MRIRLSPVRPLIETRGHARHLALLLLFVVLLQFGYPVTLYGELWTGLYMLLYAGMIFFGILAVRGRQRPHVAVTTLGVVFVVFATWFSFVQESRTATLSMLISVAAFMFALMFSLMRFVFGRGQEVGAELIMAAVSVYLILGGFFAAVFSTMEILHPGSFEDPATPGQSPGWQQMIYYSYVTMATLGYGEILPITPWARSLAAFQTVAGTLFLTVVIARLVGIWASSRPAAGP